MKLQKYPTLRAWWDMAIKLSDPIDLLAMDDWMKDKAIASYCLDMNYLSDAMRINSDWEPQIQKNIIYARHEHKVLDLIDDYHIELNEAEESAEKEKSKSNFIDIGSLAKRCIFQDMYDAGHKHSDF